MFGSRGWVAQDSEEALAHGEVETDHQRRGCPMTFTQVRPPRTTHRRTLNVVGSRYKRVEHRVGGPSVRSGAAECPKSTVGVDLHMCFAVDHVQDQPVRPDDERGALDRSDEREKAWGDPYARATEPSLSDSSG
jgi:hypothetical protein